MKRKPLHPRANAQTKAAGMPQTPPAATSPKPVIPTSTNAPDSTEARRARQWEMVQRIADLGLVIAFAGFVASGVTHCMDAARASKAAQADSAPTPLNPIKNTSASAAQIPSFTIINTSASNGIITTGTGFPCLVLDTPQSEAVATPTDKRGFITPIHKAGSGTPTASRYGYGRDALTRKDSGTASDVCLTSRPPFALRPAAGGLFNIPEGI